MASQGSGESSAVGRFDLSAGLILQEFGYDEDVDMPLREAIEQTTGEDLVDEEYGDVTDGAIVWFREDDDDLADLLMDAQTLMDDGGTVWLLTPKAGRPGHVVPGDIQESASLAGLHGTSTFVVGSAWSCTQLVEKGVSK